MYVSLSVRVGDKRRKNGKDNEGGGKHRAQRRKMVIRDSPKWSFRRRWPMVGDMVI